MKSDSHKIPHNKINNYLLANNLTIPDPKKQKQRLDVLSDAFPDSHYTIDDMIAEGDRVVIRWTLHATYKGVFLDIPPTGTKLVVAGIDIYHIASGKIAQHWHAIMKIASVAAPFFSEYPSKTSDG